MSERERAIQLLKELPDTISMKEILEALSAMVEINTRIDELSEDDLITSENVEGEIDKW